MRVTQPAPARRVHRRAPVEAPQAAQDAEAALPRYPGPPDVPDAQEEDQGTRPVDLANGAFGLAVAAVELGMTTRDLQGRCRDGTLPCRKAENSRWLVDLAAARAVLAAEVLA